MNKKLTKILKTQCHILCKETWSSITNWQLQCPGTLPGIHICHEYIYVIQMYMVIHYWLTIPETFNHYNFAWFSKHQSSAKT